MRPDAFPTGLNVFQSQQLFCSQELPFDDSPVERALNRSGEEGYNRQVPPDDDSMSSASTSPNPPEAAMENSAARPGERDPIAALQRKDHLCGEGETPVRKESRSAKLSRIRREIELGIYDTPERLEAAFEIMFERLDID